MVSDTDSLRNLYVDATGTEAVTGLQRDAVPHTPAGDGEAELEHEVSEVAREDGLDGPIQGTKTDAS